MSDLTQEEQMWENARITRESWLQGSPAHLLGLVVGSPEYDAAVAAQVAATHGLIVGSPEFNDALATHVSSLQASSIETPNTSASVLVGSPEFNAAVAAAVAATVQA